MSANQASNSINLQQWQLFKVALAFFTRIPVKISGQIDNQLLSEASRYFGLVGVFIGAVMALSFYLLQLVLPLTIVALLLLAINLLLTGAFHEDGLADVWDGFGGGWQVEDKLNIMKDSRLGTYGAASLFIALALKYQSWQFLGESIMLCVTAIIIANGLSRCVAASLIYSMPYVQQDENSKVKPLANAMSGNALTILLVTATALLALPVCAELMSLSLMLTLFVALFITRVCLKHWFHRQLGGYTGDCLGAAQVITEVITYIVVMAFIKGQVS